MLSQPYKVIRQDVAVQRLANLRQEWQIAIAEEDAPVIEVANVFYFLADVCDCLELSDEDFDTVLGSAATRDAMR